MFALPKKPSKTHLQNMNKHKLSIKEDVNGEMFFEIPPQLLKNLNWNEGDELEFIEKDNGKILIRKLKQSTD